MSPESPAPKEPGIQMTGALRQPQDYRKVTVRFIARLPQESHETHGYNAGYVRCIVLSCDRLVTFARLSCGSLSFDVR